MKGRKGPQEEKVARTGAVRGPESGNGTCGDAPHGRCELAFQIVLGPDGQGAAEIGGIPQVMKMRVKILGLLSEVTSQQGRKIFFCRFGI